MFEFLKRRKIKDRAESRQSLLERGHKGIPHHGAEFDSVLTTIITQEMLSSDLYSQLEPSVDIPSVDSSPSVDSGGGFDGGGGTSGGGGADGDW